MPKNRASALNDEAHRAVLNGTKCLQIGTTVYKDIHLSSLGMVEAAGVEPLYGIHSKQLVDFRNGKKFLKSMICKSTVQTLYKNLTECHELQTAARASKHPLANSNIHCGSSWLRQGAVDDTRLHYGNPALLTESLENIRTPAAAGIHSALEAPPQTSMNQSQNPNGAS